jgi:hypothetical protein
VHSGLDAVDVAVVEVFQAGGEPLVPAVQQHEPRERVRECRCPRTWEQVHDLADHPGRKTGRTPGA